MCYGCYEDAGLPNIVNDDVIAAAALVSEVYKFSPVGGNAHIVLDDWNLEDEHIQWCLNEGLSANEFDAEAGQLQAERSCLESLLKLPSAERHSAMAIYEGFLEVKKPSFKI